MRFAGSAAALVIVCAVAFTAMTDSLDPKDHFSPRQCDVMRDQLGRRDEEVRPWYTASSSRSEVEGACMRRKTLSCAVHVPGDE